MNTPTKRPALCLKVEGTVGSDIEDCMREACALAARLGLAYVCFDANDIKYTCYDFGKVLRFTKDRKGGDTWTTETGWVNGL